MKVGITFSTFDLFHAGHVKMLEKLKLNWLFNCWSAVRSINWSCWENKPSQSIIERYIQVKGSKHVDEIVPYVSELDLEDILKHLKLMYALLDQIIEIKTLLAKSIVRKKELRYITIQEITILFQWVKKTSQIRYGK